MGPRVALDGFVSDRCIRVKYIGMNAVVFCACELIAFYSLSDDSGLNSGLSQTIQLESDTCGKTAQRF